MKASRQLAVAEQQEMRARFRATSSVATSRMKTWFFWCDEAADMADDEAIRRDAQSRAQARSGAAA